LQINVDLQKIPDYITPRSKRFMPEFPRVLVDKSGGRDGIQRLFPIRVHAFISLLHMHRLGGRRDTQTQPATQLPCLHSVCAKGGTNTIDRKVTIISLNAKNSAGLTSYKSNAVMTN
jgi:hypothetical protein